MKLEYIFMTFCMFFLVACTMQINSLEKESNFFSEEDIIKEGVSFTIFNETIKETEIMGNQKLKSISFIIKVENKNSVPIEYYLGTSVAKDSEENLYALDVSDYFLERKGFSLVTLQPNEISYEHAKISFPLDTIIKEEDLILERIKLGEK